MSIDRQHRFVSFRLGYNGVTFLATRVQVISVLTAGSLSIDEGYFEFKGTESQLNEAGVGNSDMFAGIATGKQRTRTDEYGDRYMLAHLRDHWVLGLRTTNSGCKHLPSDLFPKSSPWWLKHGGAAEATTAKILKGLARPVTLSE